MYFFHMFHQSAHDQKLEAEASRPPVFHAEVGCQPYTRICSEQLCNTLPCEMMKFWDETI